MFCPAGESIGRQLLQRGHVQQFQPAFAGRQGVARPVRLDQVKRLADLRQVNAKLSSQIEGGTKMGADAAVRSQEANQMIADAVDLLVQIGIRHETRRVVAIANVSKELKNGDVWFEPIYRYNEAAFSGEPR